MLTVITWLRSGGTKIVHHAPCPSNEEANRQVAYWRERLGEAYAGSMYAEEVVDGKLPRWARGAGNSPPASGAQGDSDG